VWFDADESVARLHGDADVRREIGRAFGPSALGADGAPDREFLREKVFSNESARRRLEAILHPRVRRDCLASRDRAAKSTTSPLFLADIPLLFETAGGYGQDMVVVVAASPPVQALRLRRRNGFEEGLTRAVLAAQMSIAEKIRRADMVIWNNGTREALRWQTEQFLSSLSHA